MRRLCAFALALLFILSLRPCVLRAQTANASITGWVMDPSKAAITEALVAAVNTGTNSRYETATNGAGEYVLTNLPPGTYRIEVKRSGFKNLVRPEVILHVQDALDLEFELSLGGSNETITVQGGAPLVNTSDATVSSLVEKSYVENLPLNGRDTLQLALTQPGVLPSTVNGGPFGGLFTIAGGRDDAITYLLDGGENTSVTYGVPVADPNPDTIAEFRVIANDYSAEYGRSNGGLISVVTKSGADDVHGTAFDYLRNTDFDANSFFNKNTPGGFQPRPILRRNQFGGTIGGPITIPRLVRGKDRFFFFFGYQGQRQNSVLDGPQVTTYTPTELTGDFSQAVNDGPPPGLVSFLRAHPYFQSNPVLAAQGIINPASIDLVAQAYIKYHLIPTSPSGTLTPNGPALDNRDEFTVKTDFNVASADHISITLVRFHNPQNYPFVVNNGAPNVPGYPGDDLFDNYFGNASYIKIISPSVVNEFRFVAQRGYNSLNNPAANLPKPSQLGINITPDDAIGPTQILLNASNLQLGFDNNGPAYYADTTYDYIDSLTWIRGKHDLKAGASLAYVQNDAFFAFQTVGGFAFNGPSGIGSGTDLADFLLGVPDIYSQYPGANSAVRSHQVAGYFQDDWKIDRNVTFNLGLRYEYQSPKQDPEKRNYMIIPGKQSVEYPNAPLGLLFPGDPGAPPVGINFPDRTNFAPRFGLAWDPFGRTKTSVRAGFGMFYDVILAEDNQDQNGTPPFYSAAFIAFDPSMIPATGPAEFLSDPFGTSGTINPFPSKPISKDINFATSGFLPFGPSSVFVDPYMKTPYTYQYNLTVQQQLASGLVLEAGYVGSSSHRLIAGKDRDPFIIGTTTRILNTQPGLQIPDAYAQMPMSFGNYSNANYNGLIFSLTKRSGELRGIGRAYFTASYTWAHNLDDADGFARTSSSVAPYNQHQFYSSADSDIRQRFVLSGGWELPFAMLFPNASNRATQGWNLDPIFSAQSGFPSSVTAGLFQDGVTPGPSGDGDQNLVMPNWSGGSFRTYNPGHEQTFTVAGSPVTGYFFFNPGPLNLPACYASSAPPGTAGGCPAATYGTLQRNSFRGPGRVNLDLALEKKTRLTERVQLNFRAEFFNALNHTEWQTPATTSFTSPLLGQVTSTWDPRIGQLALRLQF